LWSIVGITITKEAVAYILKGRLVNLVQLNVLKPTVIKSAISEKRTCCLEG